MATTNTVIANNSHASGHAQPPRSATHHTSHQSQRPRASWSLRNIRTLRLSYYWRKTYTSILAPLDRRRRKPVHSPLIIIGDPLVGKTSLMKSLCTRLNPDGTPSRPQFLNEASLAELNAQQTTEYERECGIGPFPARTPMRICGPPAVWGAGSRKGTFRVRLPLGHPVQFHMLDLPGCVLIPSRRSGLRDWDPLVGYDLNEAKDRVWSQLPIVHRSSQVFWVCFAIDNRASFEAVKRAWAGVANRFHGNLQRAWLVGCKSDLRQQQQQNGEEESSKWISEREALALVKWMGFQGYFEFSAKDTGENGMGEETSKALASVARVIRRGILSSG